LIVFIAPQHAMHAEHDIMLANLSVCLSVCLSIHPSHSAIISIWMHILSDSFHSLRHDPSFLALLPLQEDFKVECERRVERVWQYVHSFRHDSRVWQTDRRTDTRTDLLTQYHVLHA